MIAATVDSWERSCIPFVDVGLEALGCQNKVCLVVNLPTGGMPRCCSRQLGDGGKGGGERERERERVGKDESVN